MFANFRENIRLLMVFLVSLILAFAVDATSWAKSDTSTNHVEIIYSSNTSGFTEPSG